MATRSYSYRNILVWSRKRNILLRKEDVGRGKQSPLYILCLPVKKKLQTGRKKEYFTPQ